MASCIETGCSLEQESNRRCILHNLKAQVEVLAENLDDAITDVNRQIEEERTAKESAEEALETAKEEAAHV